VADGFIKAAEKAVGVAEGGVGFGHVGFERHSPLVMRQGSLDLSKLLQR
jgi:hypothetical protein